MKLLALIVRQGADHDSLEVEPVKAFEVAFVDPWWTITNPPGETVAKMTTQEQAIRFAEELARASRARLLWRDRAGVIQGEKDFSTVFSRKASSRRSALPS